MKVLLCCFVLLFLSVSANAQLQIQYKLEKDGTDWVTIDPANLTYELVPGTTDKVVYPETPDPNSVGFTDKQEWYVLAEDGNGFNLVSFSAAGENIPLGQHWVHYSLDGTIWSPTADKTIMPPPAAVAR